MLLLLHFRELYLVSAVSFFSSGLAKIVTTEAFHGFSAKTGRERDGL